MYISKGDTITAVIDIQDKLHEFWKLAEEKNNVSSLLKALDMADEFDERTKKILLAHEFFKENWFLINRMLERGFDPSKLLEMLNALPLDDAWKMVDKIGHSGLFKDNNGFQFVKPENLAVQKYFDSRRIDISDEFKHMVELDDFQTKFEEFKDLLEGANDGNLYSRENALLQSFKFDDSSKKIILNHAFLNENWYLTRRMLERGFDPSELLKSLNNLPVAEAIKKADSIGYYGIYKYGKDFRYKWIRRDISTPLNKVEFNGFRFLRAISSDIQFARHVLSVGFRRIFHLFVTKGFKAGHEEISKLGEFQKSVALALMVASKKWEIAKKMLSLNYGHGVLQRLLDQYPDTAAVEAYEILNFYKDFEHPSTSNLFEFL